MPKDSKVTKISLTVGIDQVVDELVISFTHDTEIEYLLPGAAPTGRYVEIPNEVMPTLVDDISVWEKIAILSSSKLSLLLKSEDS